MLPATLATSWTAWSKEPFAVMRWLLPLDYPSGHCVVFWPKNCAPIVSFYSAERLPVFGGKMRRSVVGKRLLFGAVCTSVAIALGGSAHAQDAGVEAPVTPDATAPSSTTEVAPTPQTEPVRPSE